MASIFSKIAAGEIPSYKCAESDKFYAFLDISPIGKGHTLVIPRKEVDYIFDMEDKDLAEFEVFAKKVAKAIKAAFPCKKVAQVVLGLEVPHAHIHLIPMNSEADVNFRKEHLKLTEEEFKEIADKIYTEFKNFKCKKFQTEKELRSIFAALFISLFHKPLLRRTHRLSSSAPRLHIYAPGQKNLLSCISTIHCHSRLL